MIAGTSSSGASCVARCTIDAVKIAAAILFSLAMTSSQVCLRENSTSSLPQPRSPRRLFERHALEIASVAPRGTTQTDCHVDSAPQPFFAQMETYSACPGDALAGTFVKEGMEFGARCSADR